VDGGTVTITFKGDDKDLEKTTEKVTKSLKDQKEATQTLKDSFGSLGKAMTVGVTLPLVAMATAGVKYNAELESYNANLTTLLGGNKKQAEELLQTLKETAKTTPYETSQLVKATQTMMAFGVSAKDAKKYLNQIGDISMGNAEKLSGLTLAFSQVQSAGRLTGQDLLQMINQGFNPLNIISKETGESMASLKERMSEGGVSAQEVAKAFEIATSKGGLFYKGMDKGSKTTEGRISTLKDSFKEMTGSLTESLLPVLQKLVISLTKVFDWFGSLNSTQQKTILIIAGVVASIGPMLSLFLKMVQVAEAIKKVTLAMQTLGLVTKAQAVITKGLSIAQGALNLVMSLNPIALVIIAITALIAIFIVLWNKCEGFRNFWIGLWEGIKNIFFAVVNWIKTKINETINSFNYLKDKIKGFINSIIGFFTTLPSKLFNIGKDMLMGLVNGIKNVKSMAINSVKNLGKNILSGIRGVLGIHSPSKEFALIGKYSVVGYTEALDDMKSNVQNTIDDVFGIDPTMYNNASTHLSPNINMTVVNNMDFDPIGQVVNRVKTYSGGSKNDYNYGQGVS
jgi:tape measure domain-containing protein